MPTISTFFGIAIRMYFDEHGVPHFHAYYGEHSAVFEIQTLQVLEGSLPRRAQSLVREWAQAHRQELMVNWVRAEEHRALNKISPLE